MEACNADRLRILNTSRRQVCVFYGRQDRRTAILRASGLAKACPGFRVLGREGLGYASTCDQGIDLLRFKMQPTA